MTVLVNMVLKILTKLRSWTFRGNLPCSGMAWEVWRRFSSNIRKVGIIDFIFGMFFIGFFYFICFFLVDLTKRSRALKLKNE